MNFGPLQIPYVEFHITNVCNMNCTGCNRMSDENFKGVSLWSVYADTYREWAKELRPRSIALFGGEPMLNPEFSEWVRGVRKLWPITPFAVATNGSRLRMVDGLYNLLHQNKVMLVISLHNKQHRAKLLEDVKWLLKAPLKYEFDNSTPYLENLSITDANNVKVLVKFVLYFHSGPVVKDLETGKKTLQQSDPIEAHNICHSKYCHVFYKGKLYKCGLAALFPEYDKQFTLDISNADRQLIEEYRPLSLTDTREEKIKFIENIRQPIDQCKFCPQNYEGTLINAGFKNNKQWPIFDNK